MMSKKKKTLAPVTKGETKITQERWKYINTINQGEKLTLLQTSSYGRYY